MSAIPPNWLGGIVQSSGAQARQGAERASDAAAQVERARAFTDRLTDAIQATERDTETFEDSEGNGGSRGRPHGEEPGEAPSPAESDAGGGGLDLSA